MRLNVSTPTGASYVVEVDGDDTVASVKSKLQGMTGVHPAQQRLVQSGGRKLTLDQDTHTLAQYHSCRGRRNWCSSNDPHRRW
jgi:hypothetical protein